MVTTNITLEAKSEDHNNDLEVLSKLINISGRQRMLSQRIAFLILAKEQVPDECIESAFSLFEESHILLKNGNSEFPCPERGSALENYFFGEEDADTKITSYIRFAKDLYEGLSSDLTGFIKVANEEMVPLLNRAVLIYEDMSHNISVKMTEQMESNNVNLIQTFENVQHIHNRIKIISVNASIIASKAGIHGQAFNVVVSEIRSLAGKIHKLVDDGLNRLKIQL